MNNAEIEQIRKEIEHAFLNRRFGKVFPLSRSSIAIDFHPHNSAYLFIDIDTKVRKAYLIRRRLKELERSSVHSSPFVIRLRKVLSNAELVAVSKKPNEKMLRLDFVPDDDTLSGMSLDVQIGMPNILILDSSQKVIAAARETHLNTGDLHSHLDDEPSKLPPLNGRTLSEILDEDARQNSAEARFDGLALAARKTINGELAKLQKLTKNLEGDLARHGDADEWKRLGDLLLANISNIRREGPAFIVTDFFDPELAERAIAADENQSPTEAAEGYFRRYTKARNGAVAVGERIEIVAAKIAEMEKKREKLESAINAGDEEAVEDFLPDRQAQPVIGKKKEKTDEFKGARKFVSTDGFEILVGKKAKDNDLLTFRVAKSLDLWLHAADYPGSHVVVRNPNRKDVPIRTITEAAQLAAFYSEAREIPKAAVNYTPKKFVNKPKRSAPGLVSLASFKTILVEPKVPNF